jgi:cytochrome b-561
MLPWHIRAGLVVYVLALLAAELGFLEKLTFLQAAGLGRYSSEALLVNVTALLILLLGASVVLYVTAPMHNSSIPDLQLVYPCTSKNQIQSNFVRPNY